MSAKVLFLFALIPFCCSLEAATYYVATNGNDSYSSTQARNPSTPKASIAAGIGCLSGGDTLIAKGGTYQAEITNVPSGTDNAYTVVMGEPGNRPKITKIDEFSRGVHLVRGAEDHHIEVRGFEFDSPYDGVKIEGWIDDLPRYAPIYYSHHFHFIDNIVHDTKGTGMLIASSQDGTLGGDHLIKSNEFYQIGIGTPGYHGMNTIYNPGNRTIIEFNIFHNVTNGVGIYMGSSQIYDVIVRNNLFYDVFRSNIDTWQQGANGGAAIHASSPGGRHLIYNNIIYRSGFESIGIGIGVQYGANGVQVFNNTIYGMLNPSAPAIYVDNATSASTVVKNNIAYQTGGIAGGTQSNNLTTDPNFVNAAAGDFHLQSNSPAIGAGANLYSQGVTTDFDGKARPQTGMFEIGAYEYTGSVISRNLQASGTRAGSIAIRPAGRGVMIYGGNASATVYTLAGKTVAAFENIGSNGVTWSPKKAQSGVYLVKVTSGNAVQTSKVFCGK